MRTRSKNSRRTTATATDASTSPTSSSSWFARPSWVSS